MELRESLHEFEAPTDSRQTPSLEKTQGQETHLHYIGGPCFMSMLCYQV